MLYFDAREEDVDDARRALAAAVREAAGYWVPDAILDEPEARGEAGPGPARLAAEEAATAGARGVGGN